MEAGLERTANSDSNMRQRVCIATLSMRAPYERHPSSLKFTGRKVELREQTENWIGRRKVKLVDSR